MATYPFSTLKEEYCIGILRRVEIRDRGSGDMEDPKAIGKIPGKGTHRQRLLHSIRGDRLRKGDGDSGQVDKYCRV